MIREDVGNRIKLLRESRNFTREELAERAEISSKFLYEVEKGRKGLSADTLLKISRALSCSCDYILTGESYIEENDEQLVQLFRGFSWRDKVYVVKLLSLVKEMGEKEIY